MVLITYSLKDLISNPTSNIAINIRLIPKIILVGSENNIVTVFVLSIFDVTICVIIVV